MTKYRVVKAYPLPNSATPDGVSYTTIREQGDIVRGKLDYPDRLALHLGALEEIKPWEPKVDDWVLLADHEDTEAIKIQFYGSYVAQRWLKDGLIYPTREQAEECRKRMLEAARKYKEEVLGG